MVSVVNMKGGVGKSTTVASLAEALACEGVRVLVIDLDPQSNVSMMLAGQDRWIELRSSSRTIDEYFNQYHLWWRTEILPRLHRQQSE